MDQTKLIAAEYTAAAGPDWGWVKVLRVGGGYLVKWGDNAVSCTVFVDSVDLDDLASWLEDDTLRDLDAIIQTANVRGASAVSEAGEDDEGPFYILETRHWYGATETSDFVFDDRYEPLEFASLEDARKWIEEADDCVYYLAHNESFRPTYKVVRSE